MKANANGLGDVMSKPVEKHVLQEILEETRYAIRAYSGRGIGKPCLGVEIDGGGEGRMFAKVLLIAAELGFLDDEVAAIAAGFRSMRIDPAGRSTVLIYFEAVEFVAPEA